MSELSSSRESNSRDTRKVEWHCDIGVCQVSLLKSLFQGHEQPADFHCLLARNRQRPQL